MMDTEHLENLRTRYNTGETMEFAFFWGHQPPKVGVSASCFSQWYDAPFTVDEQTYTTAEHFMMAEKAKLFGDETTRGAVLLAATPNAAKALGREVRNFDDAVWQDHRFSIVVKANRCKFAQNAALGAFLQETGQRVLVEASPMDRIWGIGLAKDDARVNDPNQWQGLNLLGFALMQVRDGLGSSPN